MKCSIDICDREAKKRKLCLAHYQRFVRDGDQFDKSPIVDIKCIISRFKAKIGPINDNGCMEWLGWKKRGYGRFNIDEKVVYAHRFSYEHYIGPIPKGRCVCHTCDNPSCVNPKHLWVGTNEENQQDMRDKGRASYKKGVDPGISMRGSNHIYAKLDEEKVKDIKIKLSRGIKGTVIAREYNVVAQTIYEIKNGKNWKHIAI